MPFGSDFVGRPVVRVAVTREEFTVPRQHVLCSCAGVIRLRVNGTITKHDAWASNVKNLGTCPMSGQPAKSGDKL